MSEADDENLGTGDVNPAAGDEERLRAYGQALVAAVDAVIGDWVRRCVSSRCAGSSVDIDEATAARIERSAEACRRRVVGEMRDLLSLDVDEQTGTPLQILRSAVSSPTEVLAELGVEPVDRDDFDRRAFPDDLYGLTPAGFGDVDGSLVEPGIAWGAAKAHVHRRRHAARR